ncbi:hypothetical protein [Flectobacillus major]|uniref:hypothetical protein n=1 Tax=Flectobacillus major TaxID=103 RepID=UPI0005C4D85D|nr:hypothetical protein [Flectobacillus major]
MSKKNKTPKTEPTIAKSVSFKVVPPAQVPSQPLPFPIKIGVNPSVVILVIAVFLAFGGGFGNKFVEWDDPIYILDNTLVKNPSGR